MTIYNQCIFCSASAGCNPGSSKRLQEKTGEIESLIDIEQLLYPFREYSLVYYYWNIFFLSYMVVMDICYDTCALFIVFIK